MSEFTVLEKHIVPLQAYVSTFEKRILALGEMVIELEDMAAVLEQCLECISSVFDQPTDASNHPSSDNTETATKDSPQQKQLALPLEGGEVAAEIDDVRHALIRLTIEQDKAAAKQVLARFHANKVGDLKPSQYSEVVRAVEGCLSEVSA